MRAKKKSSNSAKSSASETSSERTEEAGWFSDPDILKKTAAFIEQMRKHGAMVVAVGPVTVSFASDPTKRPRGRYTDEEVAFHSA